MVFSNKVSIFSLLTSYERLLICMEVILETCISGVLMIKMANVGAESTG